jgi:hypothetical protein
MGTLEIKGVAQDANDRTGQTFVLSFKRDLESFERFTVPLLLTRHFSPTEAGGPADVTVRQAHPDFFTNPETRANLKKLVADAEAQANEMLSTQHTHAAQKSAHVEETNRQLGQIDWDS